MVKKFSFPLSLKSNPFHYCAGCGHGIVHRLIAEIIDELKLREKTIGVCPVGCAVVAYDYFNWDMVEVAHGRAPAVGTAIKRVLPDRLVFTYQGDGDLASIGMAEIVHTAARGEPLTVIFINNATYGMTGGQMAPTTLEGQKTTTTPLGRDVKETGYPLKVPELLSSLPGVSYLERTHLINPRGIRKTRKAIKRGFLLQLERKKFSLIEILSPCPTCWRLTPLESLKWMKEKMLPYFTPGVIKEPQEEISSFLARR